MPDGTGYEVVPESLRKMVIALGDAATRWKAMAAKLEQLTMAEDALGLLGHEAHYPGGYNEANELIVDKLDEGGKVLDKTIDTLEDVARHYEEKDAEWYSEFGYIEKEM